MLCSKVPDIEFCNVKALCRRTQVYMTTGVDLAKFDIKKALEIDPDNKDGCNGHTAYRSSSGHCRDCQLRIRGK